MIYNQYFTNPMYVDRVYRTAPPGHLLPIDYPKTMGDNPYQYAETIHMEKRTRRLLEITSAPGAQAHSINRMELERKGKRRANNGSISPCIRMQASASHP
ncbi:hypothetical protein DPMN_053648 [Dreissena polymorpha]|uniref:Uncharacterized protein n=1 Tax=Dreissena polymorpha TaxID=45954 RepID=A0A9D4HQW9_DREPO|nr:hypothetical protein DPMN_053648 [Dreissena polymorpha]